MYLLKKTKISLLFSNCIVILNYVYRMIRKDGNKAYGFVCNLSSKDEIYSVSKAVKQQVGNISILINNAGIVSGTSLLETPDGMYISILNRS